MKERYRNAPRGIADLKDSDWQKNILGHENAKYATRRVFSEGPDKLPKVPQTTTHRERFFKLGEKRAPSPAPWANGLRKPV